MQEQHPYKMTPDQGWSGMSSLLDKAMPVERRSRRFIPFWWSAAAVVSAALIAFFVLMNKPGSINPSIAVQENTELNIPQTHDSQIEKPGINSSTDAEPAATLSPGKSIDESTSNVTRNFTPVQKTKEVKEITDNSTLAHHANKQKDAGIAPVTNAGQPEITAEITNNQETISHELATPELTETEAAISFADRNNPGIDFLPSVWAPDLDFPAIHVNSLENILVCCEPKKRLIVPHLAIGGVKNFAQGAGVHGGVGLDLNVTKRLSVATDLAYNVYNPDFVLLGDLKAENSFAESDNILRDDLTNAGIGTYLPAEEVNNASGSVISHFVQTIRQWQFSAGVKYDISGKFFAQAGMMHGFGTSARSSYPVVTNDYFADPLLGNQLSVSRSLDDYDVVRSNTTSLYAGIGYRPCMRTEIFAQWMHGLDPYLINDPTPLNAGSKRTDYIRGMNVGLRYTL